MRRRLAKATGIALLVLSALAVLQTVREILLFTRGEHLFEERTIRDRTFSFAGRRISIDDDQPVDSGYSEVATDGLINVRIDGTTIGVSSRAGIRRHHNHLGRYHGWYDASIFRRRSDNDSALFLVKRVQPGEQDTPRFEITIVDGSGQFNRRILRAWQLGWDYRVFRSTQFIRQGTWTVMPFTLSSIIGVFPVFLIFFPIGTALLGIFLVREPRDQYGINASHS